MILVFTINALLEGSPWTKMVMGASFSMALSLVVMAGAELFTGNSMVMCTGSCRGSVSWRETLRLWTVCYLGNWVGSLLIVFLYRHTALSTESMERIFAATTYVKMSLPPAALFIRAMFCNTLLCLAIWCGTRCKSETAKLIMIFWCIYAFFTSGFEHSIVNMSVMAFGLLTPGDAALTVGGYFYNLAIVTAGNIAGGALLVAVPYYFISGRQRA